MKANQTKSMKHNQAKNKSAEPEIHQQIKFRVIIRKLFLKEGS